MRYVTRTHPAGILVLDSWTGELALVRADGSLQALRGPIGDPRDVLEAMRAAVPTNQPSRNLIAAPAAPASSPAQQPPPAIAAIDPNGLPVDATALDREVVATFPYPIAIAWRAFLVETDARVRCRALVDAFTQVLKYVALLAASDYLHAQGVRDAQVNETLARGLQRPLISAWSALLKCVHPAFHEAGASPFIPEIEKAYDQLEAHCRAKVPVVHVVEGDGTTTEKVSQLPVLTALVNFRNTLAHGVNLADDRARREIDRYLPPMRAVLQAMRFLTRYPLLARDDDGHTLHPLMGARPDPTIEQIPLDVPDASTLFVRDERTGALLPLFLFFDVGGENADLPGVGGDVLLWEGSTKSAVLYLSTSGEHREKRGRLERWRELLARKAVAIKVLTRETLSLDALRAAARRATDESLDALVASGKYLREVAMDRPELEVHIDALEEGAARGLLFGGESGIGKSTLLARLVERWSAAGDVVLFYRASALSDPDLAARVVRDLGFRGQFFEEFLEAASPCFGAATALTRSPRLRVVVDALNEHKDLGALCRNLDDLVEQMSGYSWVRMVVSVRTASWDRLRPEDRIGARARARWLRVTDPRGAEGETTPLVNLQPLQDDVQCGELYERYRAYRQREQGAPEGTGIALFRPTTTWRDLDPAGSTRALLRSPLMVRLVLAAHARRALPSHLTADDAMRLFVAHVVLEEDGPAPRRDRGEFLRTLVRMLDQLGAERVERDALYEAPQLREAMRSTRERQPTYADLLDLGVLLEEWEQSRCWVRFAFDRLLEYLLAEHLDPKVDSPAAVVALAERAVAWRPLRGTLILLLLRACGRARWELLTEAIGDNAARDDVRGMLADAARAATIQLARLDGGDALETLLGRFVAAASEGGCDVLCRVFDDMMRRGDPAAEPVATAAVAVADALASPRSQAEVLRRKGRRLAQRGAVAEAEDLFLRSLGLSEALGDKRSAANTLNLLGIRRKNSGDLAGAEEHYRRSLALMEEVGSQVGVVIALTNLSFLSNTRGDLAAAEDLGRRALLLKEEMGSRERLPVSLTNLGSLLTQRGDLAGAEELLRRALTISEELGSRSDQAGALNALGNVCLRRGDLKAADDQFRRVLAIRQSVSSPGGEANALTRLGLVAWARAEFSEAERHVTRAIELLPAGNKPQIARAIALAVGLALDLGRVPDDAVLTQFRLLAASIATPTMTAITSALELRLALRAGTNASGAIADVARAYEAWSAIPAPEESAATALYEAATHARERGDRDGARELAGRARASRHGYFHVHGTAIDALCEALGV